MTADNPQFQAMIDSHWAGIFRLCLRLTGNSQDAEEMAQQSFYKAFRAWDNFQGRSAAKTWLFRIAINTCREHSQKRGRMKSLAEAPEPAHKDTNLLEQSETAATVRRAMDALAPKHRLVLTLFCLDEMSHKDIAQVMECSEGTVWSRLHYARQALSEKLHNLNPAMQE